MLKSVIKHALKKFGAKKGQCLALACWLACSPELTPWSLFLTHALAVKLVQNHERTLSILSKIVLAGLQVLLSSAYASELSWACGRVFQYVF